MRRSKRVPTPAPPQEAADVWRERLRRAWERLLRFLRVLLLAALTAVLLALPWVLAAGTVLLWLAGIFRATQAVAAVYGPGLTHPVPLWAIQVAPVLAGLALPVLRLASKETRGDLWGALAVAGAGEWLFAWALPRLLAYAPLETLLFPAALGLALHTFFTLRFKFKLHTFKEVSHERPV